MGTKMPILRRSSAALSSALLEWILMLLLFIDAVYCFLVTRFARLCKLPAPCPFCSRLDHVLGNEKPCFYRELICKTHKSEISSLAFCRLHQKLAGLHSMCEGCSSSIAAEEKPNNDDSTDEPLVDVNVFDSDQGEDAALHSPLKRICSCCAQHFKRRSVTLFSRKNAGLEPAEAAVSGKVFTDYSMSYQVDGSLEPKDIYHQGDHTSHDRYSVLQMTSVSEIEVPCVDDGGSSHPHEANDMEKDLHEDAAVERPILPSPEVVKAYEMDVQKELNFTDSRDISSACPVVDGHPDSVIGGGQMEAKDISSGTKTSQHDPLVVPESSDLKDADVSQIPVALSGELPQVLGEIEVCQRTSESAIHPYTSQFTILEQHYAVSGDRNIKDHLEEAYGSEITATSSGEFHQRSALTNDSGTTEPAPQDTRHVASEDTDPKDNFGDIHVSQVSGDSETVGAIEDYPKKTEPTADVGIHEPTSQDTSNTASKDLVAEGYVEEAHISQVAIRSSGEVSQGFGAIEEHPQTSEIIGERRPSLSNQISMNEAYKLAIGSKSGLPSPTLTDVILGKDTSSSVNEELRLLLSQLSASRGLETPWVDSGPSPRAYGRGDDLIVQNITKRISIERNASGLESLDGSIVSEIEGESTMDRLRRQIDLHRKSIHLLCKELEEERNASAVAASQALAMITRLQDEKAAMQMEASHYQRMMEEQAEYDSEALAKTNELLAQREQQIEELEAELENYRIHFGGGGPTEKQTNQVPFKEENTTALVNFEDERAYIASRWPLGWMYQERALYLDGDNKLENLNKATELDPTLTYPYMFRAASLMKRQSVEAALMEINRVLGFKLVLECLELRFCCYLALEDYRAALCDVQAILTLAPDYRMIGGRVAAKQLRMLVMENVEQWTTADCWMQLYDRWSSVDDIGSLSVIYQMLESDAGKGVLYFRQSLLLLRLNCPEAAMCSLQLAREHAASQHERLVYEGWILYDTGHCEEGLQKAEASIAIQRSFEAFFLKAYALADSSLDPSTSATVVSLLEDALRCPSDRLRKGQAQNNLGSVYVDCGKLDLAAECYINALKIGHTRAHQGLARVHLLRDNRTGAYEEMTKLIEKARSNASAYEKRSEYCDRELTKADLQMVTKLDPLRVYPYRYRAAVLMDNHKEKEAIAELTKAIAFKADLNLLHLRAAFHEHVGDISSALRDCRTALSVDPNHQEMLELHHRVNSQEP